MADKEITEARRQARKKKHMLKRRGRLIGEQTERVKENNYSCSCLRSFFLVFIPPSPLYPPIFPSLRITL